LEPGLLGRLAKPQSDYLLSKIKDFTQLFDEALQVGIGSGALSTEQAVGAGKLYSELGDFSGALKSQKIPNDNAGYSASFYEGKLLYKNLSSLANLLKIEKLAGLPEIEAALFSVSKEPYKGSIRLDTAWNLPPSHLERLKQDQELAAEKARLEEAARKEAELQRAAQIASAEREMAREKELQFRDVRKCTPAFVRLDDNNLLMFHARDGELHCFKTSSGYAEYGREGGIGFKGVELGGGSDYSKAHVYGEISYLEAIAYVRNNVEFLKMSVRAQEDRFPQSLHAEFILSRLLPLIQVDESALQESLAEPRLVTYGPTVQRHPPKKSIPVFVALPDSTMLRIIQSGDSISFEKTASGYGVDGWKVNLVVVKAGAENPTHNQYTQITAPEALAFFDGDIMPIFLAVCRQAITVGDKSVWPASLWKVLCPTKAPIEQKREQYQKGEAPRVAPSRPGIVMEKEVGFMDLLAAAYQLSDPIGLARKELGKAIGIPLSLGDFLEQQKNLR
jgi:hypothetical protein